MSAPEDHHAVALFVSPSHPHDAVSTQTITYAGQTRRSCMDAAIRTASRVCVPRRRAADDDVVYSVRFSRLIRPRAAGLPPLFEFENLGAVRPRPGLRPEYLDLLKPKTRTLVAHGLFAANTNGGIVRCRVLVGDEVPAIRELKGQLRESVVFEWAQDPKIAPPHAAQVPRHGGTRAFFLALEQTRMMIGSDEKTLNYRDFLRAAAHAPEPAIKDPPFVPADRPHRLALLIVEPREHPLLAGVLRRFVGIYKNEPDVSLTVVHGTKNGDLVAAALAPWPNARVVSFQRENLTTDEYSELLCSRELWDLFQHASHALVFQTDTWLFRPVPDVYFEYAYTGAPWNHVPAGCRPLAGGNGGLSLRRVADMRDACAKHRREPGEAEDVFFCRVVQDLCPFHLARAFSVEHVYHDDPVGMHRAYEYLSRERFVRMFA